MEFEMFSDLLNSILKQFYENIKKKNTEIFWLKHQLEEKDNEIQRISEGK